MLFKVSEFEEIGGAAGDPIMKPAPRGWIGCVCRPKFLKPKEARSIQNYSYLGYIKKIVYILYLKICLSVYEISQLYFRTFFYKSETYIQKCTQRMYSMIDYLTLNMPT